MSQLAAEAGNRLLRDGERFLLMSRERKVRTIATGSQGVIYIVKKPEGHFHFGREGWGANKMLVDWGAREVALLDFHGYDADKKPFHIEAPCTEIQKMPVFKYRGWEAQYQLKAMPEMKTTNWRDKPKPPQGELF